MGIQMTGGGMELLGIAITAIFIGATLQRISGFGVGLIVAPVSTLLFGPALGVLLTNACTTLSGLILTVSAHKHVQWFTYRSFALWLLPGSMLGALLVSLLPSNVLQIIIGVTVLTGLLTTVVLPQLPYLPSPWIRRAAGFIGGAFNTTAGVAAPVMVIYSHLTRWDHRSFAATMQPTFMTMGLSSVFFKSFIFPVQGLELPPWWILPLIALTIIVGAFLGATISRRISRNAARNLGIFLAFLGAFTVLIRGLEIM